MNKDTVTTAEYWYVRYRRNHLFLTAGNKWGYSREDVERFPTQAAAHIARWVRKHEDRCKGRRDDVVVVHVKSTFRLRRRRIASDSSVKRIIERKRSIAALKESK